MQHSSPNKPELVLASASTSRREMLKRAGVECLFEAADIDEAAVKNRMIRQDAEPGKISEKLAVQKAQVISRQHPGKIILGADQLLVCAGRVFDKPRDMAEAAEHLRFFCGKTHYLYTSYALILGQKTLKCETMRPRLTMRGFSPEFLEGYIKKSGNKILGSVGCYLMEDLGPQLFSEIEGDYFTILGLPLLNVMESLRELAILKA